MYNKSHYSMPCEMFTFDFRLYLTSEDNNEIYLSLYLDNEIYQSLYLDVIFSRSQSTISNVEFIYKFFNFEITYKLCMYEMKSKDNYKIYMPIYLSLPQYLGCRWFNYKYCLCTQTII